MRVRWIVLVLACAIGGVAARADEARLNPAIARLAAGEAALGVFSADRDPMHARLLGASPLDFVIIDMEHQPWDAGALRDLVAGMRAPDGGFAVAPIVRIPANGREVHVNQWMVKQALDAGAFGIMVPHVNTAEQAENVVVAARYPPAAGSPAPYPHGERGWAPLTAAGSWGLEIWDYTRRAEPWPLAADGELLIVVQIETKGAIDNLAEILAVPGVGAAFIGPADLHMDMGFRARLDAPEVEAEIQRALAAGRAAGVPMGITTNAENVAGRLEEGFRFVTVGFDVTLGAGIEAALKAAGRE